MQTSPCAPARKKHRLCRCFFQLNPPFRVGEILLRNVKFSLRSNEIAAAAGGFNFIWGKAEDFISVSWFHPCATRISFMQGFEFIRKNGKNIFFVAHRKSRVRKHSSFSTKTALFRAVLKSLSALAENITIRTANYITFVAGKYFTKIVRIKALWSLIISFHRAVYFIRFSDRLLGVYLHWGGHIFFWEGCANCTNAKNNLCITQLTIVLFRQSLNSKNLLGWTSSTSASLNKTSKETLTLPSSMELTYVRWMSTNSASCVWESFFFFR